MKNESGIWTQYERGSCGDDTENPKCGGIIYETGWGFEFNT